MNNGAEMNELPEGFEPVDTGDGQRTWMVKETGATIQGLLLKRKSRKTKNQNGFFEVKVTKGEVKTINSEGSEVICKPGDIVFVDEIYSLQVLNDYLKRGLYEVFIRFLDKMDLENNQTKWNVKVGAQKIANSTASDDNIPF